MAHNAPPYVCIVPQPTTPARHSGTEYQSLTLPHPVSGKRRMTTVPVDAPGQPQLYYWNQAVLCELKLVYFDHERSWFAGNSVVSANNQKLELICDTKRITDSELVYRLNESRALAWLRRKVDQTMDKLTNAPELQSVCQNIFFLNDEHGPNATDEKRRVIVDMVGEYLNNEWLGRLLDSYDGFGQLAHIDRASRPNLLALDSPEDYMTSRPHPASETPNSPAKKTKLSVAARSLAKANTKGMKSMLSYFGKK
ncbi:hypothetical protein H4R35_002757 [Dimargaris xerosporica]|nr:hypothetical protein H4R35_002757 [Dimargaris xerosporica]